MHHGPHAIGLPGAGQILSGKYRIDAVVGSGGMGVVMAATDTSLGRPVAIKFLSPEKASKEGAVARFMREARAAAALESEHVVKVFEVATAPTGAPYIVMELLRGADLSNVLARRGPLPMQQAVDLLLQACEALSEAHARGIVHRDLKPQNLFVTNRPDGSPCVKVLDFGISKAADSSEVNLTSTDMVMGTPLYMSPEQVRSLKSVDHRTDIWSLGAILQELLTQRPAFDGVSASALCAAIAMDPPVPLRARRPDLPPELEAVILRCLHKDPAGRFPEVASLGAALAPFASDRGRQSAARLAVLARSGSLPHGANAASFAPTVDSGGHRASMGPPLVLPPPPGVPSQATWGPTTTSAGLTRTSEGARGGTAVVVVAGVLTGLLILAALGGAGYYVYAAREAGAVASVTPSSSSSPRKALGGSRQETDFTPGGAAADPSASIAPDPSAPPASPTAKPAAPKPAASPKPATPPAPTSDPEADRIASQRRLAQSRCNHWEFLMRTNDPKNNDVAKRLKPQVCLPATGANAARCERTMCARICQLENDQMCLTRLQIADRNHPTRF